MPSSLTDQDKAKLGVYTAPRLTIYGEAKTLTAAGTGATAENAGGGGGCSGQTDRRPC